MKRLPLFASAAALALAACAHEQVPPATPSASTAPSAYPSAATGSSAPSRPVLHARSGETRQQLFNELDADHDGTISQSEAQANPDMMVLFVQTDANGDQIITPVEFVAVPIVDPNGNPIQ